MVLIHKLYKMEKKYIAPEVEIIEVEVEKGFASSVPFSDDPGEWD